MLNCSEINSNYVLFNIMYRLRFEYSADLGLYWFVEVTCPENLIFWMGFVSYENLHWEFFGCHLQALNG